MSVSPLLQLDRILKLATPSMKTSLTLAFAASALAASPANPFSNYFSVGFAENGPFIKEVSTTLVLPPINPTQKVSSDDVLLTFELTL